MPVNPAQLACATRAMAAALLAFGFAGMSADIDPLRASADVLFTSTLPVES